RVHTRRGRRRPQRAPERRIGASAGLSPERRRPRTPPRPSAGRTRESGRPSGALALSLFPWRLTRRKSHGSTAAGGCMPLSDVTQPQATAAHAPLWIWAGLSSPDRAPSLSSYYSLEAIKVDLDWHLAAL